MKLKKMLTISLVTTTISGSLAVQTYAQSSLTSNNSVKLLMSEDTTVSPLSDIIEWRYKEQNGKLYKRLFNYTKEKWVGDWQLVS
jgi:hypothetical protein